MLIISQFRTDPSVMRNLAKPKEFLDHVKKDGLKRFAFELQDKFKVDFEIDRLVSASTQAHLTLDEQRLQLERNIESIWPYDLYKLELMVLKKDDWDKFDRELRLIMRECSLESQRKLLDLLYAVKYKV
jgi:hypothetical protein